MATKSKVINAEKRFTKSTAKAREKYAVEPDPIKPFAEWLPTATPAFVWNKPFQKVICSKLDQVTIGDLKRLFLFAPPRHGKSEMVTVHYAAWRIIKDPTIRIIIGAY